MNACVEVLCPRKAYWTFRHRTSTRSSPCGTSRGLVVHRCRTDVENTPQTGQADASTTCSGVRHDIDDTSAVTLDTHPDDPEPGQPEQQRRTVFNHSWSSSPASRTPPA